MVWYNRILYNSIKEYTPHWMKTIPYNQTARTRLSKDVLTKMWLVNRLTPTPKALHPS